MSLIPWWLKLLVLAAIVGGLYGGGYYHGHKAGKASGEAELASFRASVETEAAKQAVHSQQVIAQQQEVTQNVASDYETKLAALRAAGRVQHPTRADGSQIPVLSCTAPGTDAAAANAVPAVESVPKADYDQLRADAAVTTLMLVKLQDFTRGQQAAFP